MRRALPLLAGLALALFAGCQQFFTTSLAEGLAREPEPITSLDAGGAADFAEQIAQNPDQALAQSAVSALADLVAASPTAQVVSDAAAVAVVATGLGSALTESLTSIDIQAVVDAGQITGADADTVAAALSGVVVNADTTAVFEALAAADPAELAAQGVDATVFVVAAAALAVADMEAQSIDIAEVLDGSVSYSPTGGAGGALATTLDNLAAAALVVSPDSQFADLLQSLLGY